MNNPITWYCQNFKEHLKDEPVKVEYGKPCPECKRDLDFSEQYSGTRQGVAYAKTGAAYPKDAPLPRC